MTKATITQTYAQALQLQNLAHAIANSEKNILLKGLIGSSLSIVISEIFKTTQRPFVLILNDKEEAAYYLNDFEQLLGDKDVLFYPESYRRPYEIEETNNASVLLRAKVLNRISTRKNPAVIITYPDALFEKVIPKKELQNNTLKITVGNGLSIDFLNEVLFEYQFKRVDFVTEPGEFSLRGGIIDVFSFSYEKPFRIEFFGDEIDSIRIFDVESQLSTKRVKKAHIIPNVSNKLIYEQREIFLKYIPSKTIIFNKNIASLYSKIDELFSKAKTVFKTISKDISYSSPKELFCSAVELKKELNLFTSVYIGDYPSDIEVSFSNSIIFNTKPQPVFNKQFNLLIKDLNNNHNKGFINYITCTTEQQAQRFHDIFESVSEDASGVNDQRVHYKTVVLSLYQGFIDETQKIAVYTDHQIFDRYHKFHLKNGYSKKQAITLKELNKLEIDDYVTHIDHGIGKFGGLQKIDIEGSTGSKSGKKQEAIKLIYGEGDVLYLSIHSLHKISKFNSKDGKAPKLYKLGSKAWKKLKQKTKSKVKEIAFNLIKLYASRKIRNGFQYAPDSYLQHELEASFIYEDTPDQITATATIKTDMESAQPMDRLICGDVGFGKTEVAIRAAFKAVDNEKQVAILVPTTILAYQHYRTLTKRLEDFPVGVDYMNRFRTAKEKRLVLEGIQNGSIDIVIGTHQLVNKNVKFKDLGLLIVDEEQKFGVSVKDKLKTIKENVDVLTLTATPIPRTLQFSLMAARDLSVINTPPPNRYPIENHVIRFNEEIIRDAVVYEIQRGGQVFFVHNRVENIKEVAGMLQRLVPDAKIATGHGQMEGKKLEELMLAFMNASFDVLVSTTIIESGLDIPNANTIFINNANHFGLSDLHQMRGRVGRSNKKAFCYFITPDYPEMTTAARKRITALEQFTELGSGFNIAMKDLEIRGAGDLLGGEQSGFINEIGFDTYQKILNETIEELKENEFSELYKEPNKPKQHVKEVAIDTDLELLFPDDYINNISERLNLYTKLNSLKTEEELTMFENEITDRFGSLPKQVMGLIDSVRLKWLAIKIGLEKLVIKRGRLAGYFIQDQKSTFYQGEEFSKVLQFVQQNSKLCTLKEKQTRKGLRLLLTFENVKSIAKAMQLLKAILG